MSLLEIEHLSRSFRTPRRGLRAGSVHVAVDDVGLVVEEGETVALVGESGAGKSTTGRLVLRLIEPDAGTIRFDGRDVRAMGRAELRRWRSEAQMIFQNPTRSLDPRTPVGLSVAEPLLVHRRTLDRRARLLRAAELLERVGLGPQLLGRRPEELSGGQLQRVAIARALACEPRLIVCDEPLSALDMSVRTQVLDVMGELQRDLGIAYLFISHDLALTRVIADRVAVMSRGAIVEQGPTEQVFASPQDPFTRALLDAVPSVVPKALRGAPSTPTHLPPIPLEER